MLLAISQLVLPGLAASTLRHELARNGTGVSVRITALPAVELLWHDADEVDVRMASYRAPRAHVSDLLGQSSQVGTLHVTIGRFSSGVLTAHDVSVAKSGNTLSGSATILGADLDSATRQATAGVLQSVTPVAAGPGQLALQGTTSLLPVVGRVTAQAVASAQDGKIVVQPHASGLLGLVGSLFGPVTVWSDPKVRVSSLSGNPVGGGLAVRVRATVG